MNEKEKALKLVQDIYNLEPENADKYGMEWQMAKKYATICVDEILKALDTYNSNDLCNLTIDQAKSDIEQYNRVKQEIENL